jgi:hypothetical protein
MDMISNARELRALADRLGVRADWHEPDEQGVTARVEGAGFDNAGFWPASNRFAPGEDGVEAHVIISQDDEDAACVNLASLLAMASYPDGPLR